MALQWQSEWTVKTEHTERLDSMIQLKESMIEPEDVTLCGRQFIVRPHVFSPAIFLSAASEFLCDEVCKLAKSASRFLEVGCGCGFIALSVALENRDVKVDAVDISVDAVGNTRENALRYNVGSDRFRAIHSDVFDSLEKGAVYDVIFWNYPFIHTLKSVETIKGVERGVRDPYYAGLRRYLQDGRRFLCENGRIFLGFSPELGIFEAVQAIAKTAGWSSVETVARKEIESDISMCVLEFTG